MRGLDTSYEVRINKIANGWLLDDLQNDAGLVYFVNLSSLFAELICNVRDSFDPEREEEIRWEP